MWRKVIASILALIGTFGLFLVSFAVEFFQETESEDVIRQGIIEVTIVGIVTLACLVGALALLLSSKRQPQPMLGWTPPDGQWLHQRWWSELPDPLPRTPRRRKPALPACAVPPDELLRKLWLVRAEIARGGRLPVPVIALVASLLFFPVLIFFIASVVATVDNIRNDELSGVEWFFIEMLGLALFAMVMGVVRPLRRHLGLVRLERELTGHDLRRPGGPRGGLGVSCPCREC